MASSPEVTMPANLSPASPASLPSSALARRLSELCRAERNLQADFLLHLAEFDARHAYLEAGYGSLWTYCMEALHLRESAAGRRTRAMKVLREFPRLEPALRDGRLCLTTLGMLGPLLTEANLDDLVARAAFLSKADVEKLLVSLQPRTAPREGLRRLPGTADAAAVARAARHPHTAASGPGERETVQAGTDAMALHAPSADPLAGVTQVLTPAAPPPRSASRVELRPVAEDRYSLRVTVDEAFKRDLEELAALTSHTSRGDLRAVLHEALRCAIAKHGKRRGAVEPERKRAGVRKEPRVGGDSSTSLRSSPPAANEPASAVPRSPTARMAVPRLASPPEPATIESTPPRDPRAVPIEVRRAVWKRDAGRCAWVSPDGRRCGSRYQLELDHIEPVALGGRSTIENIRLACKGHNIHAGIQTLGLETMAPHLGKFTDPSGSHDQ
jgi:hypothetical protein